MPDLITTIGVSATFHPFECSALKCRIETNGLRSPSDGVSSPANKQPSSKRKKRANIKKTLQVGQKVSHGKSLRPIEEAK